MRDQQLDIYRALIMMYIVCVVHLQYWLEYLFEPISSLSLFEMPVVFFVSGAVYSLRKETPSFLHLLYSRVNRVLIPFYVYAMVSLVIAIAWGLINNGAIPPFHINDIGRILLVQSIPNIDYVWHIWFIIPYFFIVLLLPLQSRILGWVKNRYVYVVLCVLLFGVVSLFPCQNSIYTIICQILGYNVFFVLGWLFYRRVKYRTIWLSLMILMAVIGFCGLLGIPWIPMQGHKFPIDMCFIIYGIFALCVLSLLFGRIELKSNYIIELWNIRGFTIYLYQNFVFIVVARLMSYLPLEVGIRWCYMPVVFCALWLGSMLLSYFTYPLESIIIGGVEKIWKA